METMSQYHRARVVGVHMTAANEADMHLGAAVRVFGPVCVADSPHLTELYFTALGWDLEFKALSRELLP